MRNFIDSNESHFNVGHHLVVSKMLVKTDIPKNRKRKSASNTRREILTMINSLVVRRSV